jgi:glycosyltransferase domain-containing protein
MNRKLTLLLCLKDRSEYSKSWIANNIYEEFEYIVADGSADNKNQIIFNANKNKNVKYIKYSFDKDIKTYINKVVDALDKVNTPYVMRVDNDDILLKEGLDLCIKTLDKEPSYKIAQANIRGIFMKSHTLENPKYVCVPGLKEDFKDLVGLNGIDGIKNVMSPYRQLWYGIYAIDVYKDIWSNILESEIKNVFLLEFLQSQLAVIHSSIIYVDETYYLRLSNPNSSTTINNQTDEYPNWHNIFFDEDYRNEVKKMANFISMKIGTNKEYIYDIYRKTYANLGQNNARIRILILNSIKISISKIFLSVIPYLSGSGVKKISKILNYFK